MNFSQVPKTELHLHIEGTLEPELMFELAEKNGVDIPFGSVDEVRQAYKFTDLQSFLDIYYQGADVLIHEDDFYALTWAYLLKCKNENIVHVEIFFDPQTHTDRGIDFGTVINGISRALKDAEEQFGITSLVFMCFLRHLSEDSAWSTLESSMPYQEHIYGVGLDSSEVGNPPSKFESVFSEASKRGYKVVCHAGEEGPPEYIWEALDLLKATRIDHGVRCLEDDALVGSLIRRKIPLTVCPLSNVELRVFDTLKDHNLKAMLDRGLFVTIHSDDPAYFGGYLNENYQQCVDALDLNEGHIKTLLVNSFLASNMSQGDKSKYINQITQHFYERPRWWQVRFDNGPIFPIKGGLLG